MSSLLDPLTIGSVTAPSRVVLGPHETNLGRGRAISERHVAYYERRAAGGAGVIVVEEASVHPSDWPLERAPLASDCGPGWSAVVEACSPHGTVVLAALGHSGGQGTSHWSQRELWAPSRVPEVNTREVPKWMEPDDIDAVIDGFAAAARLAMDSGCSGVEVNAGQFSLVRQFLSGLTNQRDDEWGQDRTLFARRVLAAVRAAVGAAGVVALRLSCDELAPWAGITPEAAPAIATDLIATDLIDGGPVTGGSDGAAQAGDRRSVDMLTVVRGSIFSAGATRPDGHTPPGFNLELTRSVRTAVRTAVSDAVAVVAQGSIVDVEMAARALADGVADAVEMTRAQIADADLVAKLRAGNPGRIRPCVLCNQTCQVRDNRNPIVTCVVDPRSGHETDDAPVPADGAVAAGSGSAVTVVGGGVAGLEAARVAALDGHRVTLHERSDHLGGAARTAASLPGRERFALFADWLVEECERLGVEIRTSSTVDPSMFDEHGVEGVHVVVATGGRPGANTFEIIDDSVPVLTAEDIFLALDVTPDAAPSVAALSPVLVWDPIGGPVGVGVAELLAGAGLEVHIATPDQIIGNELARAGDLGPANARLAQAGVVMHRRSVLRAVGASAVSLEDRFSGGLTRLEVASLVDAGHRLPDDVLWEALHPLLGARVAPAGDVVAPRTVHEAVLEGRRVALEFT